MSAPQPPGRLRIHDAPQRLVVHLPADLTPLLELGWLFVATVLVVALLPAALLGSAAAAVVGVLAVGAATATIVRRLSRRYAAVLVLTPDDVTVQYNRTRQTLPWTTVTALEQRRLGSIHLPPLAGLRPDERRWLSAVVDAHRDL